MKKHSVTRILVALAVVLLLAIVVGAVVQPEPASARTLQVQIKSAPFQWVPPGYLSRGGSGQVWGPGYTRCFSFCQSFASTYSNSAPAPRCATWTDAPTGSYHVQVRWDNGRVSDIWTTMNWWNTSLTCVFTSPS
jgi:hypothetical protein